MKGRILAISVSSRKGTAKENVPEASLRENHGIEGDAHAGDWHRQVSLLASESIDKIRTPEVDFRPGAFAENLTTEGIDLASVAIGDRLLLGEGIELEITQIGKECHDRCSVFEQMGDCVMPREGIFTRVLHGGRLRAGDTVEIKSANETG